MIQAYALIDPSAALYVRGESPFSIESGREMRALEVGKYELVVEDLGEPTKVEFFLEDRKPAAGGGILIEPGTLNECYPEF